jgi:hypothetical protein
VCLGGEGADDEAVGDLGVAEAGGNEAQDLVFPLSERVEVRGRRARCDLATPEGVGERACGVC